MPSTAQRAGERMTFMTLSRGLAVIFLGQWGGREHSEKEAPRLLLLPGCRRRRRQPSREEEAMDAGGKRCIAFRGTARAHREEDAK